MKIKGITTRVVRPPWAPFIAYVHLVRTSDNSIVSSTSTANDKASIRKADLRLRYSRLNLPKPEEIRWQTVLREQRERRRARRSG